MGIGIGTQRSRGAQVRVSENEWGGGGGGGGGGGFLMEPGQLKGRIGQNFAIIVKFKPCTYLQITKKNKYKIINIKKMNKKNKI